MDNILELGNVINFTCTFHQDGRQVSINYEAVDYDYQDMNFHYIWARKEGTDYRKYMAIPKRRKIWLDQWETDPETKRKHRKYEWVPLEEPEWLKRLKRRSIEQ